MRNGKAFCESSPHTHAHTQVVFIITPTQGTIQSVCDRIEHISSADAKIYLYVVPRCTLLVEYVLMQRGLRDSVRLIKDLDVDMCVWDDGILSMEQAGSVKELLTEESPAVLHTVAKSLMKLQVFYGPFAKVRRVGRQAAAVSRIMDQMATETSDIYQGQASGIHTLVLFDRACDILTPLTLQGSYVATMQELYGTDEGGSIDSLNNMKPPFTVLDEKEDTVEVLHLNTEDKMFTDVMDVPYIAVMTHLNRKAKMIHEKLDERKDLKNRSLAETRAFTAKLGYWVAMKHELQTHISVTAAVVKRYKADTEVQKMRQFQSFLFGEGDRGDKEEAMAILEGLMYRQASYELVFRCIAMYCLFCNGLKSKVYDALKQGMFQQYGPRALAGWSVLEQCGALYVSNKDKDKARLSYAALTQKMSLYTPNYQNSSVHGAGSGFAPVAAKVLEKTMSSMDWSIGWHGAGGALSMLGPFSPDADDPEPDMLVKGNTRVVVVCFLGGVTMGEISALRSMQEQMASESENGELPVQIVIATTHIIRGGEMMAALVK